MKIKKIPEIKIVLHHQSDEAKNVIGFKWAGQDNNGLVIGQRSKFGGNPSWLQNDQTPVCECGKEMTFYAQLDSIGDEACIADCGMVYVFICFDCFTTKSILQSY